MGRADAVHIIQVVMHGNQQAGMDFPRQKDGLLRVHISDDVILQFIIAAPVDGNHQDVYIFQMPGKAVIDTAVPGVEDGDAAEDQFVPEFPVIPVFILMQFFMCGGNRNGLTWTKTKFLSGSSADDPVSPNPIRRYGIPDGGGYDKLRFRIMLCKGVQCIRVRMVKMVMGAEYIIYKIQFFRQDGRLISARPFHILTAAVAVYIVRQIGVDEKICAMVFEQKSLLPKIE